MKKVISTLTAFTLIALAGCGDTDLSPSATADISGYSFVGVAPGGSGNPNQSGVITAGEWSDLENWTFWETVIDKDDFKSMPGYWSFYNNNRISVKVVTADSIPVSNVGVKLQKDGQTIFSARTDNKGIAELWADVFQHNAAPDFSKLTIDINNGSNTIPNVRPFHSGINKVVVAPDAADNQIQVAFVVDATGSMGDELEFLKTELVDVISRVETANPNSSVATSSVFYRDDGDEYLTRKSDFTSDHAATTNFINAQEAGGGGDFPEAVHSALEKALNDLQWSANAKTRLIFLVLDAPPHHDTNIIQSIQASTLKASEKGIKIIPVTASGIDKETEFLMRFLSISTNGTYVFVTDHSGIGNDHLEATVGQYEVEFLNDLMVRLINQYSE